MYENDSELHQERYKSDIKKHFFFLVGWSMTGTGFLEMGSVLNRHLENTHGTML